MLAWVKAGSPAGDSARMRLRRANGLMAGIFRSRTSVLKMPRRSTSRRWRPGIHLRNCSDALQRRHVGADVRGLILPRRSMCITRSSNSAARFQLAAACARRSTFHGFHSQRSAGSIGCAWHYQRLAAGIRAGQLARSLAGGDGKICSRGLGHRLPDSLHHQWSSRSDQTSIGLVFAKTAPAQRVLTLQLNDHAFIIPPGADDFLVEAQGTIPNDALLLSLFPHMHLRGKRFEYDLVRPDGSIETLLRVNYHFHWQLSYRLAEPRLLKAGTKLRAVAWYDNSRNNPHNPDPAATSRGATRPIRK